MAKYYIPFVNINTLIVEPAAKQEPLLQENDPSIPPTVSPFFNISVSDPQPAIYFDAGLYDATVGFGYLSNDPNTMGVQPDISSFAVSGTTPTGDLEFFPFTASIRAYRSRITSSYNFSSEANIFTALNLKRNGPYGYCSWKQIRAHENSLIRNHKKKNIFTINQNSDTIETFIERPVSDYFNDFEIIIGMYDSNTSIRYKVDLHNALGFFDNNRISELYTGYSFQNHPETDLTLKGQYLGRLNSLIDGRFVNELTHRDSIYPPTASKSYRYRIRKDFDFPWRDNFDNRGDTTIRYNIVDLFIPSRQPSSGRPFAQYEASMWPLDIHQDYKIRTSFNEKTGFGSLNDLPTYGTNAGILQLKTGYVPNLNDGTSFNDSDVDVFNIAAMPLYSYKHLITPLTSAVSPYGMDIEGVNSGSLYSDLHRDHLISGEAYWDAPRQYGKSPFPKNIETFTHDIKVKAKDFCIVPEFRSSMLFEELQDNPGETPRNFLDIPGGVSHTTNIFANQVKLDGNLVGDFHEVTSSFQNTFFQIYSHSDFLNNFDVSHDLAITHGCVAREIRLKCKGIKKFIPYDGFYPAQRTVQIAEKFREVIYPNCKFSNTDLGAITSSSPVGPAFFGNIMTPMFAPGILYNSIKSGIAVDYPIHTSSLTIANGGINVFDSDFYIQEHFAERIPFEALVEPNIYLANKEIHCSNPHPSGNISGSATYNGAAPIEKYQYAMHNFLAETANFFLKDQNFSFIASERSDVLNINLESGSVYGFNIRLFKSQNDASDKEEQGSRFFPSLLMTGSGIFEDFTMYSNPQSFGPPSRITSSHIGEVGEHTSSYSNLGYNWAFTPPYYDGISEATFLFNPDQTRDYSIQEVFNGGVVLENRILGLENNDQMDDEFKTNSGGGIELSKFAEVGRIAELYNPAISEAILRSGGYNAHVNDCMLPLASLNINLGILKDVDLLDDDTSDTVKVAVDISSNTVSQLIIQPKWETPMFNFQHHGSASTLNMPLIGSQSVPRGMWHQYGAIETDPAKGIFMQVTTGDSNVVVNNIITATTGKPILDLSEKLSLPTEAVKLGKTAKVKVIREAIVAVPFYSNTYNPNVSAVEGQRVFIPLLRSEIKAALDNKLNLVDASVKDMVDKMQRYVMPPMFNFVEDNSIDPVAMYIFEFTHKLDQEDLAAIWQNLPPKLMSSFEEQEVVVGHSLNITQLLRNQDPTFDNSGNINKDIREQDVEKLLKNRIKWMVFKVKQKAEQNYYNKVVGETQKLIKGSPYSYNWPYDYFSLVELAKIEVDVKFENTENPGTIQPIEEEDQETANDQIQDVGALSVTIPSNNVVGLQAQQTSVFGNITIPTIPTTGSGGP